MMTELSTTLTDQVLGYLGLAPSTPDLGYLNALIGQYGQRVPWESASRIARYARAAGSASPNWTEQFWRDAMQLGTGGTCFESNRAFFGLLTQLGFRGYLTINNMNQTIGCHTAIVVEIGDQRFLVDAGYPIYGALPLDPQRATVCETPYLTFEAEPIGAGEYLITNRPHPKPYMFNLIDRPIDDATYRAATIADYGPGGFFLNRVILRKVIDGCIWRFDSNLPRVLEQFRAGERIEHPLDDAPAPQLSRRFQISEPIVAAALASLAR
jgi:N-acetyltransferase